ncbi:PREDICTED: lysine histidine transporter-like 5 [Tarenaya hassleriana]|uniref:lysine histidine transporter-like 5 n=1 Tax=Tarenaya hassleriana TaxID=28532 RepID=UPI00053C70E0|nr:PREDICTED: lysine histidine transporter-like 5 [Tarenaya hassleriana]
MATQADHSPGNQNNGRSTTNERRANYNDWLPVTASREAKWWYSAFHNVTAMVGAGVLGLPFAMSQLGWGAGLVAIVVSWAITLYSLWQLVELHEAVPGKRFDRYPELGEEAFGRKYGYWLIMPQQMLVQVASDIVYNVTGAKSLKKTIELLFPHIHHIRQTYYIIFFAALQVVLSQSPNFNSLKGVSLLAAIMSFSYSMIAFVASIVKGTHYHSSSHGVRSHTTAGIVFDALNGMGTIAFAFAGHSVVLEIQATIPSTSEVPSKKPMWKGVIVAYIIVILCYLSVAISGFWAFGHLVEDDVLISLQRPSWLIAAANFMVFIHVIGSYQVFAMPVFDQIESCLVKNLNFTPSTMLRFVARTIYVALVCFVAVCVPFFGGLLGFFGGLVFTSISYFMPCIMWLVMKRPKPWSFHWLASWVSIISIIVGVLIALFAPIGGARQIILQAKTYKLFS